MWLMLSTVTSQLEGPGFESSPSVFVICLWVLLFLHTVQRHGWGYEATW